MPGPTFARPADALGRPAEPRFDYLCLRVIGLRRGTTRGEETIDVGVELQEGCFLGRSHEPNVEVDLVRRASSATGRFDKTCSARYAAPKPPSPTKRSTR